MRESVVIAALALVAALAAGSPLAAQSFYSSRGLGLVVEPVDARSAALGGVGLGLMGSHLSWPAPSDAVGMPAPGLTASYRYEDGSADQGGTEAEMGTARFPLLMGAFPIGQRAAVTVGYGGFLDQNWALERPDTLLISNDTVPIVDRVASGGGVGRLRVGGGYQVLNGLALGLGLDLYTGSVDRVHGRLFGYSAPACCEVEWTYSGVGGLASASWTPGEALEVSASVSFGGRLEASTDDSLSVDAEYDLPVSVSLGASGRVAGSLLLALGGEWTGWSTLDDALAEVGGARDSWSVRGGVEYDAILLGDRSLPLRIGGRYSALPFRWNGDGPEVDWPDERALTGGLGLVLAGGGVRLDLSAESGTRGAVESGLEESFWKMGISFSVLGR